jgi:type IV/VI secretion system ImpK/VasF family protein
MDRVNWVVHECFRAAHRLRTLAQASTTPPAELHADACALVDRMLARAASAGYASEDARLMAYAVVALLDEVVMASEGPLRAHWSAQPLQRVYFEESVAGESFFRHLARVRADPARIDVLRVFHLALALGFEGKYRFAPAQHELRELAAAVRAQVARQLAVPEFLSPDLGVDRLGGTPVSALPWRWLFACAAMLCAVFYLGLGVSLKQETDALQGLLRERAAQLELAREAS